MSKTIRVRNEGAEALAEALGEALTTTVTTENIKKILTDRHDTHMYQHVYPRREGSALGTINMLAIDQREYFTVVVSMGYGGQYHGQLAAVRQIGERGQLRVTIAGSVTRVDFNFDPLNHAYSAQMAIPSRFSEVVAQPMIELR
jgi:hypothetical protein